MSKSIPIRLMCTVILFAIILVISIIPSSEALLFQRFKGIKNRLNKQLGISLVIATLGVSNIVLPPASFAAEASLLDRIKIEFDERDMNGKKDTQYRAVKTLKYSKTLVINKDQELIDNILAIKKASRYVIH